jgi:hypothetical protein
MAPIKQLRDNRCQEFPARQLWSVTSNNGATSGAAFVALAPAMTAVSAIPDLQQAKALLDKLD